MMEIVAGMMKAQRTKELLYVFIINPNKILFLKNWFSSTINLFSKKYVVKIKNLRYDFF